MQVLRDEAKNYWGLERPNWRKKGRPGYHKIEKEVIELEDRRAVSMDSLLPGQSGSASLVVGRRNLTWSKRRAKCPMAIAHALVQGLEGAPVPGVRNARRKTTNAVRLWSFCNRRRVDVNSGGAARALTVVSAIAHLLPLAELSVAAVAGSLQITLRMEPGKLVEPHLARRVLPTEDSSALPTVVAAIEETEWSLASRRRAHGRRIIRLNDSVSLIGQQELGTEKMGKQALGKS